MPILKSALKRMRSDKKRRARNQSLLSDLKTRIKKFESMASHKKTKKELGPALNLLVSKIDKAASKGVIHKNKASRLISRLTRKTGKESPTG